MDAKALLDSLMGTSRNAGKAERKNKKGEDFLDKNVCKYYLVGFCPEHEDMFMNIKKGPGRDFGKCDKKHFEHCRNELKAHPKYKKYQAQFEDELLQHLERHVKRADDWVKKEELKAIQESETLNKEGGNDVQREEIAKLREEADKYLKDAEDLAAKGDVHKSRKNVDWSEQLKKKADDWETRAKIPPRDVCKICATMIEEAPVDSVNQYDHNRGKVHMGFALIRDWYKKVMDAVDKRAKEDRGSDSEERKDKARDRDGDRKRSRSDRKRPRDEDDDRDRRRRDDDDRKRRRDDDEGRDRDRRDDRDRDRDRRRDR